MFSRFLYDRLLRVSRRLLDDGIKHEIWLVGDGPEKTALEQYAEKNRMTDSVRFFGYRSNPYPFVQAADLGVCSSLFEGFSTFAAECMILGKPFVTTECSGMREILGDSEFGLITDNQEDALYQGMKQILTNKKLQVTYARNAAIRGQLFSATHLVQVTENLFTKLIGE